MSTMRKTGIVLLVCVFISILCVYQYQCNHIGYTQGVVYEHEMNVNNMEDTDTMYEQCLEYNRLLYEGIFPDNYDSLLDTDGNGMMGILEIPCIDIQLPVYHHSNDISLSKGLGHEDFSSLPVGGKGSHCIICGHSGMVKAAVFSNLHYLKTEDEVILHVLDKELNYKVYSIFTVEPDDVSWFSFDEEKDILTLVTCTPNGIGTHRLIVMCERI